MSSKKRPVIDFSRNNLDQAASAYLRSHADNPVHWQQWSQTTLQHARDNDLILLVSVGYSTCHWCHVMAADSFSDAGCADYLNRYFMPIKVDREERPDIDQYMMNFLVATTGAGGWPLNVFLSPDLKPFFAMTYAAPQSKFGRPGFLDILQRVKAFYDEKKSVLQHVPLERPVTKPDGHADDQAIELIDSAIRGRADDRNGGLQGDQKFPPHCSLLYSLYRIADGSLSGASLEPFVRSTLDAVMQRGLHDHLQGGFFRYCVDRQWTIPHFEKMLYDQAMLLWNYSLAARVLQNTAYATVAHGIITCLQQTFLHDGLLCAAHDADTDHHEGVTYLWSRDEISALLTADEFRVLEEHFELPSEGNFEGKIHLLRRAADSATAGHAPSGKQQRLAAACRRLLAARRERPQPFTDQKKLTSWNALAGIALLNASRMLVDKPGAGAARRMAFSVRDALLQHHICADGRVLHGSVAGQVLAGHFLEDHAALLLFLSYCYEEQRRDKEAIERLVQGLDSFSEESGWISADEADFFKVPADSFDSPAPSAYALAEFARARAAMVLGHQYPQVDFGAPLSGDFLSLAALHTRGYVYTLQAPQPIEWRAVPPHTVQTAGDIENYCIHGVCRQGLPPQAAAADRFQSGS